MPNPFAPPPDIKPLPAHEVESVYPYWRTRQLYSVFIGYVFYYLVRKNVALALPAMEKDLRYSKADLGAILTGGEISYGISKFCNGVAADRSNARYFMAFGLLISGLANLAFGWSASFWVLGSCWMLNQWFQGMGFPPCARVLSHWFGVRERGFKWSIWATSQQVGAAVAISLSAYLAQHYHWRTIFLVPGLVAIVGSLILVNRLRDTPGSLGLPPADKYIDDREGIVTPEKDQPLVKPDAPQDAPPNPGIGRDQSASENQSYSQMLVDRVFSNPYIWIISAANFFIYVLRGSFNYWSPTYLHEAKHLELDTAGYISSGFEVAGLVGSLAAGWISDRYLQGRRAPVCVAFMLISCVAVWMFSVVPADSPWISALALLLVGFSVYGPQFMVAVMTADLASKEAAATAVGLTGIFGYASGIVTGWGTGKIVENYGWNATFQMMMACSIIAALLFAVCWKSKARTD